MGPFVEIGIWGLLLMGIPFLIEAIALTKLVERDRRIYLYIVSGVRRGSNLLIFISLGYLIGNLLIPVIIMLFIEIMIGLIIYLNMFKGVSSKKMIINVSFANITSWTIIFILFKFVFMNI